MKKLKLMLLFFKLGAMSEMAYRVSFFIRAWEALLMLATGLAVLWVVFAQTSKIGGWGWNELLMLLGIYFFFYGILNMTIAPSIKQFMTDVWSGSLDHLLIKPESLQFLASVRMMMVWSSIELIIGMVITITALVRMHSVVGLNEAAMFFVALIAGSVVLYSCWLVIASLSFWTTKIENLLLVFYNMYEAGRLPTGMYPFWLKYSLVFVVPVAVAVTIPAEAVLGRLHWEIALGSVAFAIPYYLAARWFFRYGLRRYSGASA